VHRDQPHGPAVTGRPGADRYPLPALGPAILWVALPVLMAGAFILVLERLHVVDAGEGLAARLRAPQAH
jgi:hypothetical protein